MKSFHLIVWTPLFSVASAFLGQNRPDRSKSHSHVIATTEAKPSTGKPTTTTRLGDAPVPLAEEGTWQAFLDDEKTGLVYYFDTQTGESLWEPPTATFPEVRLPRRKQRLADSLRQEYRKTRQKELMGGDGPADGPSSSSIALDTAAKAEEVQKQSSWIEGIFEGETEVASEQQEKDDTPKADAQRDWFRFFDDSKRTDVEDSAQIIADSTEESPKKDWFGSFFGAISVISTAEEGVSEPQSGTNGETIIKDKGKKFGISLTPFASVQTPQQLEAPSTGTRVDNQVETTVEEKVKKKKVQEKEVEISPRPIKIEIGSHILPHPAKVKWGGEDAVFIKGRTFGVFDGVSGADKLDGVPLYSRTLASEMKKMVGNSGVTVQEMTAYMTNAAAYADGAATGASTAVVASIGENGFLQALNIGDSYCMVIRDGKVTAKTREISHYWECPYQLSEDSPDRPRDGTKLNVELIPGDLIVMGSDGVFDNVSDDMILELLAKTPPNPTVIAKKVCDLSRKQYLDKNSITPYAKQAQRRGDPDYRNGLGGKVDDVSAVVVICK
jgi:protein phosphatase PTC7